MKAEILSIGTELLLGHVINTNAACISKKMAEIGVDVYYHSTVGDNPGRVSGLLETALKRSDIIFTTGGLGPTVDDITLSAIGKTINRKLVYSDSAALEIKRYFKKRRMLCPKDSMRQAYIPEKSIWLKNKLGTAAGLIIPCGDKIIVCLPGPPRELNPILERNVVPYIKRYIGKRQYIRSRSIKLAGISEAEVNAKVKDILRLGGRTTVGIYAHLGEVCLKITAKAGSQRKCQKNIKKPELIIKKRLSPFIYGADDENLEHAVGGLLVKYKKTIGIAESCTGGLVSSRITNVSGSSRYFNMGVIAYSNGAKVSLLGVSPETLRKYGSVSEPAALSMAKGIKEISGSDIGLGITGIAGPGGGTKKKPVGLVYMALSSDKKRIVKKYFFSGSREEIKFIASQAALNLVRTHLIS